MDSTGARDTFSRRLAELMRQRGTKQKDLADALNVRAQTVSQYTTGRTTPDYDTLCQIARYYDVSLDWLLGMSEYKSHKVAGRTLENLGLSEKSAETMEFMLDVPTPKGSDRYCESGLNLLLSSTAFYAICAEVGLLAKDISENPTDGVPKSMKELKQTPGKMVLQGLSMYQFCLSGIADELKNLIQSVTGLKSLEERTEQAMDRVVKSVKERHSSASADDALDDLYLLGHYGVDMLTAAREGEKHEQCD